MRTLILILILNLITVCNYAQNGIVEIDTIHLTEDIEKGIVLINEGINKLNALYPAEKKTIKSGKLEYSLISAIADFERGIAYEATDSESRTFMIYFTQLPIINISTENILVDEPGVSAQFSLCESNGNYVESTIGVEYRGGWTQTFPKKSLRIEFWRDETGTETKEFDLLGMRSDDDWNIQAMYNEPLRLRSKANFEMWRKMDTLYYVADEPKAINGVRQEYVELFINNSYSGIYALSERPDRKQFKLNKYNNDEISGELYKGISWGASTYTTLSQYDNNSPFWGGFEYKYPDEKIDWNNIYEFVDFVINEDSIGFYDFYHTQFNTDNAVNYFIFLNLLRASDNTGKNIFVAKYKANDPYFYIPWDLDGTYGMIWNGTQENITNDILSNGFYDRILHHNNFTDKLKVRWNALRQDLITHDNIMDVLSTQFEFLKSNGVYERELIAWKDCEFIDFDNLSYTSNWLTERLDYLDDVFNNPKLLTNNQEITKQNQVTIYPNPAWQYIRIKSADNAIVEHLKIYNSLGEDVYSSNSVTDIIDVSGLSNGVYILVIDFRSGDRHVGKVIIENL